MSTPMTRPPRADLAGGQEAVEARAAAQVEHDLTRLKTGDRLRIAAPEPEVRALRNGDEILRGVPELKGQKLGCLGAWCAARGVAAAGRGFGDLAVVLADGFTDLVAIGRAHLLLLQQQLRWSTPAIAWIASGTTR